MKDYLKPCPFCGYDKNEWKFHRTNGNPVFNVECRKCGAKTAKKILIEEAVAAWNRRAEPQTTVIHAKNLSESSLFRCSNCDWSCSDTYYGDTPTCNFCPNCGAKMDGKEETR